MIDFKTEAWTKKVYSDVTKEDYMASCEKKWDSTVLHGDISLDFVEITGTDIEEGDEVTIAMVGNGPGAHRVGNILSSAQEMYRAVKKLNELFPEDNWEELDASDFKDRSDRIMDIVWDSRPIIAKTEVSYE